MYITADFLLFSFVDQYSHNLIIDHRQIEGTANEPIPNCQLVRIISFQECIVVCKKKEETLLTADMRIIA